MFLVGTETESCQSVKGPSNWNKCLMGYVLNPFTQAIMIKNPEDGRIVARSILRMLWNEERKQPVLFLEGAYSNRILMKKGRAGEGEIISKSSLLFLNRENFPLLERQWSKAENLGLR